MPLETFQHAGIAIESTADQLQNIAMRRQKEWFANPASVQHKAEYAMALRHWAKETHNQTAMAHALKLEAECSAVSA